ncbi:centrosomal protein POC5 [Polymixia lowei]
MSSDEEETTSPALAMDSDRGSSVSSELQDEYEELLRYAVVTPKFEAHTGAHRQLLSTSHLSAKGPRSHGNDEARSHRPSGSAAGAEDGRHSSRSVRLSQASRLIAEPRSPSRACYVEEPTRSSGRASVVSRAPSERLQTTSERLQTTSDRSRQSSPDPLVSMVTEMFISEENICKMENILATWSHNLKSNVLMELRKWKVAFVEQHRLEKRKEREKYVAQTAGLNAELRSLKELLHTYETSNQRKDEVIVNLTEALDRQKEKVQMMRALTHWRLQHGKSREKAHAARMAKQHYHLQLKKKVFAGWHSLIQRHWKVQVEQACRARAEGVCVRLSTEYEAKMAEHCEAVEKAQAEIKKMRRERERYEESMKKAFMRGVCALNMEALGMFHTTEGRPEQPAVHHQHDAAPPRDEPASSSLAQLQPGAISSTRFSPMHFESAAPPSHSEAGETVGGRVVTAAQQKPSKTVTARITARPDPGRTARSNLQVMGVTPPMSSVIVERHHPVTQLTIGQAMAAKFPHSAQQSHGPSGGKSSSSIYHTHSIKVVD